MANVIITNSFVTLTNSMLTARSENASYPKVNCLKQLRLMDVFRAADVIADDYLLKINFGSAQSVAAVALLNVNFSHAQIQGHASDVWTAPSYAGSSHAVSQNKYTGRYNVFVPLVDFNYQYMRIYIPAGTTEVGTSQNQWQIGTMVIMSSASPLAQNIAYGFSQSADEVTEEIGGDVASISPVPEWEGTISFGNRRKSEGETMILTLNRMQRSKTVIFYVNDGDSSEVYLCYRESNFKISRPFYSTISSDSITYREIARFRR
jgi:hypothetical protein